MCERLAEHDFESLVKSMGLGGLSKHTMLLLGELIKILCDLAAIGVS
jgi:hypothetical protein